MSAVTIEEARGIAARGYCHPENSHKAIDGDLCEAIAREIMKATAFPGSPAPDSYAANKAVVDALVGDPAPGLLMVLNEQPLLKPVEGANWQRWTVGHPNGPLVADVIAKAGFAEMAEAVFGKSLAGRDGAESVTITAMYQVGPEPTEPAADTPLEVPAK